MMMRVLVSSVLWLCLAAGCCLAQPQPCRSPPLLQGHQVLVYPKGDYYGLDEFFYDGFGEMLCHRVVETHQNQTIHKEFILLFREGVYYEMYRHNKTCNKLPLKTPWFPFEVPKDATFQREFIIGSSSGVAEGLLVNSWEGKLPELKASYHMTFTQFGCLPVSMVFNVENEGLVLRDFYDLVVGIEDPMVFIPPAFCDKD